jgi:hypothetical protein
MRGSDPERLCSDRMVLFRGLFVFFPQKRHSSYSSYPGGRRGLPLEGTDAAPAPPRLPARRTAGRRARSCAVLDRVRDGWCVAIAGLVLVCEPPQRGVEASTTRCPTRDFRLGNQTCKDVRHARTRSQTTDETAQDRNAAVPLHRLRRSPSCHLLRSPDTRGIELVRLAPEARLRPSATRQNSA